MLLFLLARFFFIRNVFVFSKDQGTDPDDFAVGDVDQNRASAVPQIDPDLFRQRLSPSAIEELLRKERGRDGLHRDFGDDCRSQQPGAGSALRIEILWRGEGQSDGGL